MQKINLSNLATALMAMKEEKIREMCENLPSGSGFDSGTQFDIESSSKSKLIFNTKYHHMNENGYYDGLTHHSVIVTPEFGDNFSIRITGRDRNQIKDYIHETFHQIFE